MAIILLPSISSRLWILCGFKYMIWGLPWCWCIWPQDILLSCTFVAQHHIIDFETWTSGSRGYAWCSHRHKLLTSCAKSLRWTWVLIFEPSLYYVSRSGLEIILATIWWCPVGFPMTLGLSFCGNAILVELKFWPLGLKRKFPMSLNSEIELQSGQELCGKLDTSSIPS